MKPLLNNSCSQKTDAIKRKSIANKPISGKVLKYKTTYLLLEKIRNLSKPIIIFNRSNTKYAASVAFIAGYIVKK
jgi:hypothetical protein